MEATTDWRGFQSVFQPRRRLRAEQSTSRVYAVVAQEKVVAAQTDGEDLSSGIGRPFAEFAQDHANREIVVIDQAVADAQLKAVLSLGHYYDQCENLREVVQASVVQKGAQRGKVRQVQGQELLMVRHFLLEAIRTWWARVLPASYGIYLRIAGSDGPENAGGRGPRQFFMIVRRGRLESFHAPDLSLMIPDRRGHSGDVVKFLSERSQLPVQGIFVSAEQWVQWSASRNPWPEIAEAVKKDAALLVPASWGLAGLLKARSFFGV